MLLITSKVLMSVLGLLIRWYPDINQRLELQQKRVQLDTSFNEVSKSRILVDLDYTQDHQRYHKCCNNNDQIDDSES